MGDMKVTIIAEKIHKPLTHESPKKHFLLFKWIDMHESNLTWIPVPSYLVSSPGDLDLISTSTDLMHGV